MTEQEIQKQIEAVRGLIEVYNNMKNQDAYDLDRDTFWSDTQKLEQKLRTLTQTLKPYLNGEKLEV